MEKLTIGRLFREMRPGQLWTVLVAVFGLVSGAFLLGSKLQMSTADVRAERSEAKMAEFRGLQAKERFLALYLRYLIAKGKADDGATKEALDAYQAYVHELLRRGEETSDEIDLRGAILGKSGIDEATVKFGYDGSVWPLPKELAFAASAR